jgi:hypothetical protein
MIRYENEFCLLLFLFISNSFSHDYPWNRIKSIFINTELKYDGFTSIETKCTCNCNNDSGQICHFKKIEGYIWDNDTCFWKTFFNSSEPYFFTRSVGVGYGCGPPTFTAKIKIICDGDDTLFSTVESIKPSILIFSISGKNEKCSFNLNDNQRNLFGKKLKELLKCQANHLLKSIDERINCTDCK